MKLYTEEQVRKLLKYLTLSSPSVDGYMDRLTPIELPSDEEMEGRSKFLFPIENTVSGPTYIAHKSFIEGAKWMKEQILNQNI